MTRLRIELRSADHSGGYTPTALSSVAIRGLAPYSAARRALRRRYESTVLTITLSYRFVIERPGNTEYE